MIEARLRSVFFYCRLSNLREVLLTQLGSNVFGLLTVRREQSHYDHWQVRSIPTCPVRFGSLPQFRIDCPLFFQQEVKLLCLFVGPHSNQMIQIVISSRFGTGAALSQ